MKQCFKCLFRIFLSVLIICFISSACKISTSSHSQEAEDSSTTNNSPTQDSTSQSPASPSSTDTTETPVITEVMYIVKYETDHGTLPDSIKDGISVKENTILQAENLPALSAEGYAFGGWWDGETQVIPDAYKVTKNVTLTAKWTVATISYTVSFVSEHGTAPETVTIPENTLLSEEILPNLTETGFRFDGWYDGERKILIGSDTITKNLELTAKWIACWTIHFDSNGGTGLMPDFLMNGDGEPHQLNKNSFTRKGYIFIGWGNYYDSSYPAYNDEATLQFSAIDEPTEGPTLYAIWEPITYTVRFDTTKGVYEDIQVTYDENHTYHYGSTEISQNGIYVASWNTKSDGTGESFATGEGLLWRDVSFNDLSTQDGAIISLYAQWKTSSYTIILNNENGFGGVTESGENKVYINLKYGESYTLENPFIRYRYYVKNWNRKYYGYNQTNPINETYENGCVLTNLSCEHGDFVTLTPVWDSTSYRIHFDANGGSGRDWYEITGYYDEEVTMPENVYTRTGYTFICWEGGYPVGSKAINLGNPGDLVYVKAIWAKTNATSDFTLTIDAPAENAPTIIERLPGCGIYTLNLSGECDEETIIQIGTKLKEKTTNLELHLEDTVGLSKISGLSGCSSLNKIYLPTKTIIGSNALYGCARLEGVYFPNYKSNFPSIKGVNENYVIRIYREQGINNYIRLISNFRDAYPYSLGSIAEALAKVLANKGNDDITAFEGYKFEWSVED